MKRLILILLLALPLTGETSPPATSSRPLNVDANGNLLPAVDLILSKSETIDTGANGTGKINGFLLRNDTASTSIATQQNAPDISFESHGWHDDGEGDTGDDKWKMNQVYRVIPSLATSSRVSYEFSLNDDSFVEKVYFDSNGTMGAQNGDFVTASTSAGFTASRLALGTTTSPGLTLVNTTAAAAGVQQVSPSLQWTGNGWKTDVTASSQTVDFRAYVLPVQGQFDPNGEWRLDGAVNGDFINMLKIDLDGNMTTAGTIISYSTTVTAAGTTTLTSGSKRDQFFTGSTTQTVALPVTSTLTLGHNYRIVNNSTGIVTVNSSGGNAVAVLVGGSSTTLTCIAISGTGAASWSASLGSTGIGCRLTNSGNISIPNNTFTALTFDNEIDDTGALHSTSSNPSRITFPVAGRYNFAASIRFQESASGYRLIGIYVNGSTPIAADGRVPVPGAGIQTDMGVSGTKTFAAGDYIEVKLFQDSGSALNCLAFTEFTPVFTAVRVP